MFFLKTVLRIVVGRVPSKLSLVEHVVSTICTRVPESSCHAPTGMTFAHPLQIIIRAVISSHDTRVLRQKHDR